MNHNGSLDLALQLVAAAAAAGADAVKFQTFSADAVVGSDAPQAGYQRDRAPAASQREMLRPLELPLAAWAPIRDRARALGILFLSTPFDIGSVRLLVELGVPAIKIGSGDLTNLVLLRAAAAHGLPILLSTGMATLDEVDSAVADLRSHGDPPLVLLQCTSAYPARAEHANLRAIAILRDRFGVPVGYSDHTPGIATSTAAAALGAAVIEKHLTVDSSLPGPDHAASLEPAAFGELVTAVRQAHACLGDGVKAPRPGEGEMRRVARRSLVTARPLAAGQVIGPADLDALRPADGISPLRLDEVVGRRTVRDLDRRTALQADDLDPPLD